MKLIMRKMKHSKKNHNRVGSVNLINFLKVKKKNKIVMKFIIIIDLVNYVIKR